MQILHFDIKPQNIILVLDENFVPKESDFGLPNFFKLIMILFSTTIGGTPGYIAREVTYKSIGGVSRKADVYSFGKLMLEIVKGRKNFDGNRKSNLSKTCFPVWIFDRYKRGEDMELGEDASEGDREIVRNMLLVGFWSIQLRSTDWPSMRQVLELLEGDAEALGMPNELLLYHQDLPLVEELGSECSATLNMFI